MAKFTDAGIKKLEPRSTAYRIAEGGVDTGFCIQVTPSGLKTWELQYREAGKRRFLRLGHFPAMSLAEARVQVRKHRALIESGESIGPAPDKHLTGTVRQLLEHYIDRMTRNGKRSMGNVRRAIEKDALPVLGEDKPANQITPTDIRKCVWLKIEQGFPVQANRLRTYLHAMWKAGMLHDNDPKNMGATFMFGLASNPVEFVPRDQSVESVGERALTFAEIERVWNATDKELPLLYRLLVRLILATGGQRPSETIQANKAEYDLDSEDALWTIPAARTKNKREHVVPLTDMAKGIIAEIGSIFPDSPWLVPLHLNAKHDAPISRNMLSRNIRDFCATTKMPVWTPRDLRRTVKTRMGEIGIAKQVRDRLQNHALDDDVSARHYDRWDYLTEKWAAMEQWEAKLLEVVSTEEDHPIPTTD